MKLDEKVVKRNPYFQLLNRENYTRLIENTTTLRIKKGDALFEEGEIADAFYIVCEGAIRIKTLNSKGETVYLARIGKGGFFGEQAFSLSSSPRRQAAAIAQEDSVLYVFPRTVLLEFKNTEKQLYGKLKDQNIEYLKEKLNKLIGSIQSSYHNIDDFTGSKQVYPQRSVIYYQGDPAENAYILGNGAVQLRHFDDNGQLKQTIDIDIGNIFGHESLSGNGEKHQIHTYTAVAKRQSEVMIFDPTSMGDQLKQHPILSQLDANFHRHFTFRSEERVLQFRSTYENMASLTSIISLKDGREIICQSCIGADIFLAATSNTHSTKSVHYADDEGNSREIKLNENRIVSFIDCGAWEDSNDLLDLLIEEAPLSDSQTEEFSKTGHFPIKQSNECRENFVCQCMQVPYDIINRLIVTHHADLETISKQTGAATICGSCKPIIQEMLGLDIWTPCKVDHITKHLSDIWSFQLKPVIDHSQLAAPQPGQYIIIKAKIGNQWVQRSYTITSSASFPTLEVTVKKESHGLFSRWLFKNAELEPILYVSGPYGDFTLPKAPHPPIVCFVGGIGVTPAISFLRALENENVEERVYIDYSASEPDQFILKEELETITTKMKSAHINYRVTSIHGHIKDSEVENILSSIDGCHIYVCGPSGLEELVMDVVKRLNIAPNRLHVEQFFHVGAPDHISQTINIE